MGKITITNMKVRWMGAWCVEREIEREREEKRREEKRKEREVSERERYAGRRTGVRVHNIIIHSSALTSIESHVREKNI